LVQTYKKTKTKQLYKDIKSLPIEKYDLVINDFEPVSAWASVFKKKPCIGLSHQSAVIAKCSPQPQKIDPVGKMVLKNYAPASTKYGLHFERFDDHIFTPVIRQEIRQSEVSTKEHYTVYLPSFEDKKIIKRLRKIDGIEWHVFSKHSKSKYRINNVIIEPINNELFIKSFTSCKGILCGAGFETPAEALYLNKKLMVIPMKNQYEQHCNAEALKVLGIPVIKNMKKKQLPKIENWIQHGRPLEVHYPDITEDILDMLIEKHT